MFSCTRRITTPAGIDDGMNYKRTGTTKRTTNSEQRTNKERKKIPKAKTKKEIATERMNVERFYFVATHLVADCMHRTDFFFCLQTGLN